MCVCTKASYIYNVNMSAHTENLFAMHIERIHILPHMCEIVFYNAL